MAALIAVPQYQRVADTLRARILEGVYQVGDCIPAAADLETIFKVSNITVRKALGILAGEGLVKGQRGIGTVVKAAAKEQKVEVKISGDFMDWFDTASAKGRDFEQKVLGIGIKNGLPRICEQLGVEPYAPVWRMERVRWLDKKPMSYHVNFALADFDNIIDPKDLEEGGSFVELLEKYCLAKNRRDKLVRLDQNVEASIANIDIAQLLGVDFGTPVFYVELRYVSKSGSVLAVTHLYLRADKYSYNASILI